MPNSELTRRKLLAGLAAAGGAGAGVGTGTSALLTGEVDGLGATLATGTVDLHVACSGDNCTENENGTVSLTPTIQSEYGGDEDVEVSSDLDLRLDDDSNPAYVWMRMGCVDIDEENDLAEMLHLTITFDGENELLDKPLMEIGGDVEPLMPVGDEDNLHQEWEGGNPYPLDFTWELTETDVDEGNIDIEVDLPVEFKAIQSRYVNSSEFIPFDTGLNCDDSNPDCECVVSDKIVMNNNQIETFKQKIGENSYDIDIIDAKYKNPGEQNLTDIKLAIYDSDDNTVPICNIWTKHEGTTQTYDYEGPDTWVFAPGRKEGPDRHLTHMWVEVCTDESEDGHSTGGS